MFENWNVVIVDRVCQVGLTIFGIIGIFLMNRKNRWGCVFGLIAQPFWFISTFINHQWGMFILSVVYTLIWINGIYNWFFKKDKQKI